MEWEIPDFAPVVHELSLSKARAAARQVQMAVENFETGHYDAAITLAGAAEGMLIGDPEMEISTQYLNHELGISKVGKRPWIQAVNLERDWLKHVCEFWPDDLQLNIDNTAPYLYRAMRKLPLELITLEMLSFEQWYRARVDAQVEERGAT